jgi:tRNA U34 2-thiouridine synthase MnmA/TrmU
MQSWLTPSLVLPIIALILSVSNIYYTRKRDSGQDFKKQFDELEQDLDRARDRLAKLEAKLEVLEMKMELYWNTVAQQMAKKFSDQ